MKKRLIYLSTASCVLMGLVASVWFVFKPTDSTDSIQPTTVKAEVDHGEEGDAYRHHALRSRSNQF